MKITIAEYMAYRMNFFMWRVRMVMQLLIIYFLWTSVFATRKVLFGYSESMMLSYILLTSFLRTYVFGTTTQEIGAYINDGRLSNFLIRPMNFFAVSISRDIADKTLNALCSIGELSIFWLLFRPELFLQSDPLRIILALVSSGIAVWMFFTISLLVGFIGFWTPEIWGPRFLSFIIIEFLSGMSFPLDVFKQTFPLLLKFNPFQYLIYFPIQIYLGRIPMSEIMAGLGVSFVWTVGLLIISQIIWKKGLRTYEAQGR